MLVNLMPSIAQGDRRAFEQLYRLTSPHLFALALRMLRQQWVVSADSKLAQLSLTPLHPATLSANNSLELWLIPNGKAPISLGLLDSQNATQIALKEPDQAPSGFIAISMEPRGGSPTGQPIGPVLYSGQL